MKTKIENYCCNYITNILKIAKKKAQDIEKKTEELLNYAIEKGTPVLEKAVASVKEKTIEVTKQVLAKLEKN